MSEELINEARKFLATPNLGKDMARELDNALIYIRELADIAEAAEARVKELEAGEWEYGYRSTRTGNRWGSGSLLDAQLGAKAISATIERRRKPGPWLPVESEGE